MMKTLNGWIGSLVLGLTCLVSLPAISATNSQPELPPPSVNTTTDTTTNGNGSHDVQQTLTNGQKSPLEKREQAEKPAAQNPFLVTIYKPNYFLPFYYTMKPYQSVYEGNTPENEPIKSIENKFQISFKDPIWQNMFRTQSSLYLAYSQLSYWQAYSPSAFFRETDYEPEVFVENHADWSLPKGWQLDYINVGAMHESNGRGGTLERTWNRVYVEPIFGRKNWVVSIQPWIIFHDGPYQDHNPDMDRYMGYERVLISYKLNKQIFMFQARNTVESGFRRGGLEFDYSFPLTKHINAFLQYYSGYGQSLIEYNHYTNSFGAGFALGSWI